MSRVLGDRRESFNPKSFGEFQGNGNAVELFDMRPINEEI